MKWKLMTQKFGLPYAVVHSLYVSELNNFTLKMFILILYYFQLIYFTH